MSVDLNGIITWLKGWFYDKTEVTGFLNNKANVSDLQTTNSNLSALQSTVDNKVDKVAGKGLSTNDYTNNEKDKLADIESRANRTFVDSGLSSTSTNPVQNKVIQSALNGKSNTNHTHDADDITFDNTYSQSVTNVGDALFDLNNKITDLSNIKAIEVVSTLPTASSSTMNRLYVISEDNKINVYYTEQNGSSYAWHKMDSDILDELSLDWSNIQNKPTNFTPASHKHGYIKNNGELGTDAITTVDSNGAAYIVCTTYGSDAIRKTSSVYSKYIKENSTLSNLETTQGAFQSSINLAINNKIGNINTNISNLTTSVNGKQDIGDCITSIELIPKTDDETGAIRLYYGDEPTNNS